MEDNNKDMQNAPREEKERATPKTVEKTTSRDRTSELPAERPTEEKLSALREESKEVANQTIDEGNESEVQGKPAVPSVPVMKRGSTKYVDEDGNLVKKLNDAEPNAEIARDEMPQYLKLHQEVLDGADPLEATLRFQDEKPEEAFQEGKLADAEKHPRTGAAVPAPEQKNDR